VLFIVVGCHAIHVIGCCSILLFYWREAYVAQGVM
jgi:heme/copper-type cytochrome/quinol oxidase subunit 3